jgi:hypothetical protein
MALVSAMAHATTQFGFGVTRRMATLDHLTRGRIG